MANSHELTQALRGAWQRARVAAARWLADLARRFPAVGAAYRRAGRALARTPLQPWLREAREYVARRLRGSTDARQVLLVVDILEAKGLDFWIAGGWGVDALVGQRSRTHEDLDIVLSDFERDGPTACAALEGLGYRLVHNVDAGIWMPKQSLLDDGAGHRIELLSFDRERLLHGLRSTLGCGDITEEDLGELAFTTGTVRGRPVPCFSRSVQLLFHTGFERRRRDHGDIRRLEGWIEQRREARA